MKLFPVAPAVHGGGGRARIDLSASLNPLGPHPAALEAARSAELGRYPEPSAAEVSRAAAGRHGLEPGAVVPVPGAAWGLWLLLLALLEPGDACLRLAPCFGEYARFGGIARARLSEAACPRPDQRWRDPDLDRALADRPALCVLANPSNPAGTALPGDRLRRLCGEHPGTWFVVDEAFAGFAPPGTSLVDGELPPANSVVVRSLTKELALPGLRMGYLVAEPAMAERLRGLLPAWPLGAPAVAAAVAGLADPGHLRRGAAHARAHLDLMAGALVRAGGRVIESDANYMLCQRPGLVTALAGRDIAARDCASFGLAGYARLAAPRAADLEAVLEALAGA